MSGIELKNSIESGIPYNEGITIDSNGTKIRDDGFLIDRLNNGGFNLKVFITNPSYSIGKGTSQHDRIENIYENYEEYSYFTDDYGIRKTKKEVIRIITPEDCKSYFSLDSGEKRNTICIDIVYDSDGNIKNSGIYPSIFKSFGNISFFEADDSGLGFLNKDISEQLRLSRELGDKIIKKHEKRGMTKFGDKYEDLVKAIMTEANILIGNYQYDEYLGFGFFINVEGHSGYYHKYFSKNPQYNIFSQTEIYAKATSPLYDYPGFATIGQLYGQLNGSYMYTNNEVMEMCKSFNKNLKRLYGKNKENF